MRNKDKAKLAPEQLKRPVKRRHGPHVYETTYYLNTTRATAEQSMLIADALTVWTRFMLAADPTFAGSLYRALCDAWKVNRAERDRDARDEITVKFHGAFLNRLGEMRGKERPVYEGDRKSSTAITNLMRAALEAMLSRVASTGAVWGEGVLPEGDESP